MILLEKLKTLFIAEETTPGTCEESGLTAIGVHDLRYEPEFASTLQNMSLGILGSSRYFKNCRRPLFTFKSYIRGSGVAVDQPPQEAPLYKAAGMLEEITSGVSVGYTFTSIKTNWEWLTMHFFYGDSGANDYLVKACGCLLTGVMRWEPCQPGIITWRAEGIFAGATKCDFYDVIGAYAFNKTTIDEPAPPVCQDGTCLRKDSVDLVANMLEIDMGNKINPRPVLGCKIHGHNEPYFSDRVPVGSMTIEIPNPDTEADIQCPIVDDSYHTLSYSCGSVAGNQYTVAGEAQLLNLSESPNDMISGWTVNFGLVDENDQEFSLIFT